MKTKLTQVIEELTRIRDRVGDVEFESAIHGEIVEADTTQCFATENFRIVAIADADGYPVLPSLVVTPISRLSMATLDVKTEEFQRQELAGLLAQCTPKQQEFFNKSVFPNGVPKDMLVSAYSLCERTLRKNESGK
jgi:hypothetical protein